MVKNTAELPLDVTLLLNLFRREPCTRQWKLWLSPFKLLLTLVLLNVSEDRAHWVESCPWRESEMARGEHRRALRTLHRFPFLPWRYPTRLCDIHTKNKNNSSVLKLVLFTLCFVQQVFKQRLTDHDKFNAQVIWSWHCQHEHITKISISDKLRPVYWATTYWKAGYVQNIVRKIIKSSPGVFWNEIMNII